MTQFLCSCLERNIVYIYSKRTFSRRHSIKILFSIKILYAFSFSPSSPLAVINDRLPGFRLYANAICALSGFYAAHDVSSGVMLSSPRRMRAYASPAFSLDCLTPAGGNVTLFRNVGTLRKIPKEGRPHGLSHSL